MKKIRKTIHWILFLVFLFGMTSVCTVLAAPYGYKTVYHQPHAWTYNQHETFVNVNHSGCGNYLTCDRDSFQYICNGQIYKSYNYSWYVCQKCGLDWGEWAIYDWYRSRYDYGARLDYGACENGDVFLAYYLPSNLDCPGYDVPWQHTVSYNANGGSGSISSQTKTYGSTLTLQTTKPTRKGYTFKNWNTTSDGTGTPYAPGAAYGADYDGGTVTLYAQWTHNKYTVTYDSNGGSTANTTKNYYYNDAVSLSPTAAKDGMTFVGWSTNKNATKPMSSYTMPDLATSTNTAHTDWEVTLYAVYSIPVSDIENHTYPNYTGTPDIKDDEVYFKVWKKGNTEDYRTYPLSYKYDVNTMVYRYTLDSTSISSFVGSGAYYYQVIAYDNAGNRAVLIEGSSDGSVVPPLPEPEEYLQTVKHYYYDMEEEVWIQFDVVTEMVLEGMMYTPSYVSPPDGYKKTSIDEAYVVREEKITSAYYMPYDYTLFFHANGGSCDISQKSISYGDVYGELPRPTRIGYDFDGWNTKQDGTGDTVTRNRRYRIAGDSTVYAQWKVKAYDVTYDYGTNGGTSADKVLDKIEYNQPIDLSPAAYKAGWEFVGWNTDAKAITGLDSMTMQVQDVTLYAIYKKDITLTTVDQTNDGQTTDSETKTIYNTDGEAVFPIKAPEEWSGWTFLGYTDGTQAMDSPVTGIGNEYELSESGILYGLYTSEVTLTYDTNGSSMEIEVPPKDCYFNASRNAQYPEYIVAKGPILSESSFVTWKVERGTVLDENGQVLTTCTPGQTVTVCSDAVLKTVWDRHPKIEAYNRYFTLEQAQTGAITQKELLKKVKATDEEDGTLVNGVDVIVKDYKAVDFTILETDKELEITYQATDSFGNEVTKTVTVRITDTTMRESKRHRYVRFISPEFFKDKDGNLVSESNGGLEETSIWRTDDIKRTLLERVLDEVKKKS